MATHVDAKDVARIKGKLEEILPAVKSAVKAVALEAKGKVAKAPGYIGGSRKMKFKTPKQHFAVMKMLGKGLIPDPYRRAMSSGSEALSKSWTIGEIERRAGGGGRERHELRAAGAGPGRAELVPPGDGRGDRAGRAGADGAGGDEEISGGGQEGAGRVEILRDCFVAKCLLAMTGWEELWMKR